MREAPSRVVIDELLKLGASICAYDPIAMKEARLALGEHDRLSYADRAMDALEAADALVIVTEWKEFRSPDFQRVKRALRTPAIFDGRNLYDPATVRSAGLQYFGIGRGT